MSSGVRGWFTESMAYPTPTPFEDLSLCCFLVGTLPQLFVADGVWPAYLEDSSQTGVVDE